MQDLALFPLHFVLYPGMPIRLNVFELRYKRMLQETLGRDRTFGVVLIKEGVEAFGPTPEPFQVGCQAAIRKIQPLQDGQINLLAVGQQRFWISSLTQVEPFLKGQVEPFPLSGCMTPDFDPLRTRIRGKLVRYIQKLGRLREDALKVPELSIDPKMLAFSVCNLLQLPLEEKQALLEIQNLLPLLNALDSILGREIALFKALLQRGPLEMMGAFGLN